MKKFDAVIIGTGQAGLPLTRALAEKGWKVAVIERSHVGGTCINYGCTPTKTMWASARRAFIAKDSRKWGIETTGFKVDIKKILERKNEIVLDMRRWAEGRLKHKNITLIREKAHFVDTYKIQAGDETIEGEKIFINTGLSPVIPDIPGLSDVPCLDSTSVMELTEVPKHLVILGGGYVGLEFSQIYKRLGSEVTIIQRGKQLADTEDEDIAEEIKKVLENEGVKIMLNTNVVGVKQAGGDIMVDVDKSGKRLKVNGSHLLVATGRKPNTWELDLERAGIKTDEKGYIKVNEKLETNIKNIWALGDCKGGPAFTHVSYDDYVIVYKNIVEGGNLTTNGRVLVYAMFLDPSLGRVGLTEKQAREKGFNVVVAEYPIEWIARGIELGEKQGKMKIVVDKKTEKILGGAVLSYEGAELVHILAAYMNAGATYKVAQKAIATHPTLAEGIQSLVLAIK